MGGFPPPSPNATSPSAAAAGSSSAICANCGAPDSGDYVMCRFCTQAVSADALRTAIPCPNSQCRTACRWGKQKCPQCQAWLVVSCVFCGAISPHNISNCMHCNEAFAGASQRKAQMQQQVQHQQHMQSANVWGGVAASFLGAAAGSAIGSSWGSSYNNSCRSYDSCSSTTDSVDTFDVSNVSDDTSFDFDDNT
jgi:hypothetical protein